MTTPTRNTTLRVIATLAMLASPVAAGAQQRLQPVRASANEAAARASQLHAQAQVVGLDLKKLRKAAHLHEQSASQRELADPQAFACLQEAALLRYYSGQRREAATLMERAARTAAEQGDVVNASRAYSDAAIMAHELRQGTRAWSLALHADALTSSPLLTAAQREHLRMRNVQLDRGNSRLAVNGPVGSP